MANQEKRPPRPGGSAVAKAQAAAQEASASANQQRASGASAGTDGSGTRRVQVEETTDWTSGKFPWWKAAVPAAVGLAGISAYQMIGGRHRAETDVRNRAEKALQSQFPGASLRFHGRDAIIDGVSPEQRDAAHKLIRDVRGVRNVKERLSEATGLAEATEAAIDGSTLTIETIPVDSTLPTPGPVETIPVQSPESVAPAVDTAPAPDSAVTPNTAVSDSSVPPTTISAQAGSPSDAPPQAAPAEPVDVLAESSAIRFESASCEIGAADRAALASTAAILRDRSGLRVEIAGHSDSIGTPNKRLARSVCRADAVRQALIDEGVSPDQIRARGYGSSRPVDTNDTEDGRANNRRAEIVMVGEVAGALTYTG